MPPRLAPLLSPPIGFGHRGAMAHAPENTMESFELALRLGATGIESDVWVTADGVAVLHHDGRFRRGLRRRWIADLDVDELPPDIPTLAQLYEVAGTDYPISLDLKTADAFDSVMDAARAAGGEAEKNLWLCHPDLSVLMDLRPKTDAKLVNSTKLRLLPEGPERRAAELTDLGIDALNLFHREWSGGLVALVHRFDKYALGWGAQHEREIAKLLDGGIDGVYSDHVDRLVAVIDAFYQS